MTNDILTFLEDNWGKHLRVFFTDGTSMDCIFDGFSYDYDEDDNEILELDFEHWSSNIYFETTPEEIEKIEIL